jgi:plasmid stabilization system protein ParE
VRSVIWHPLALEELHEAAAAYKLQRKGRDERFLSAVEQTVGLLERFPLLGKSVHRGHRGLVVHRFPYSVIYRVRPKSLQVVAIAHHKQKPTYWAGRA